VPSCSYIVASMSLLCKFCLYGQVHQGVVERNAGNVPWRRGLAEHQTSVMPQQALHIVWSPAIGRLKDSRVDIVGKVYNHTVADCKSCATGVRLDARLLCSSRVARVPVARLRPVESVRHKVKTIEHSAGVQLTSSVVS